VIAQQIDTTTDNKNATALGDFQKAKEADQKNEMRPSTPAPAPLLKRKSQSLMSVLAQLPASPRLSDSGNLERKESIKNIDISIVTPDDNDQQQTTSSS